MQHAKQLSFRGMRRAQFPSTSPSTLIEKHGIAWLLNLTSGFRTMKRFSLEVDMSASRLHAEANYHQRPLSRIHRLPVSSFSTNYHCYTMKQGDLATKSPRARDSVKAHGSLYPRRLPCHVVAATPIARTPSDLFRCQGEHGAPNVRS
jgi:hypothetical protein